MKAEIYSRNNCVFCDKAKMRLAKHNPKIYMLDKDYTREYDKRINKLLDQLGDF